MPELPEVQTTVNGVKRYAKGKRIVDVWTDYGSPFHEGKSNIKNRKYFARFKKEVAGRSITGAERIGKNVIIHLSGGKSIVVHMKMTGHLLFGEYAFDGKTWTAKHAGPLRDDGFNRFIHLLFTLSGGKHLALSDMRKFARVSVVETSSLPHADDLDSIGPDPLNRDFTYKVFKGRLLKRPAGKIKQALMEQKLIAGIGNIYSDEILWRAGVHPLS
ncbi:MAG TPA: DNA-formamidopyrimidine glycosylase family protein, partial [Candidatus Paceibacterota bacterium]|nr:DNA-formamidopyrimidine glycosylase family protein [Candidatus Paceibacterota bacterium]